MAKPINPTAEYLNPTDAAQYLGIGRTTLYAMIARGLIKCSRLPSATGNGLGMIRIKRSWLDEFAQDHANEPGDERGRK